MTPTAKTSLVSILDMERKFLELCRRYGVSEKKTRKFERRIERVEKQIYGEEN